MIIRFDDVVPEAITTPRGGKGSGESIAYAALKGVSGKIKMFNMMILEPDSAIGYHKHKNDMEVYIMLDGTGKYNDNGLEVEVEAGDAMICDKGESHSLEALKGESITFLAFIIE